MKNSTYELYTPDYENAQEILKRTDSDGTVWWIPLDPTNSDYAKYLASLEATEPEAE
jgi:hypothetical protein